MRSESTVWMNRKIFETKNMKDMINNPLGITNMTSPDVQICHLHPTALLTDQSLSRRQSGLWQRSSLSLKADTSLKEEICWWKWQKWEGIKSSKGKLPVKRMSDNEQSPEAFHFCQIPVTSEMEKRADTADISMLFFSLTVLIFVCILVVKTC